MFPRLRCALTGHDFTAGSETWLLLSTNSTHTNPTFDTCARCGVHWHPPAVPFSPLER